MKFFKRSAFLFVLLGIGHGVADMYASFLTSLGTILTDKLALSMTAWGFVVGLSTFSTSFLQIIFGLISDRLQKPWLIIFGPVLAGVFLSAIGLSSSYLMLVLLVFAGGCGVAAYHPQAAAIAGKIRSREQGLGMAVFVMGGSIGVAMPPLIVMPVYLHMGPAWTWLFCLVGIGFALFMYRVRHRIAPPDTAASERMSPEKHVTDVTEFRLLVVLSILRNICIVSLSAYVPIYIKTQLTSQPIAQGAVGVVQLAGTPASLVFVFFSDSLLIPVYLNAQSCSHMTAVRMISIMQLSGTAGGLIFGYLSDRMGKSAVVLISQVVSVPLFFMWFYSNGITSMIYYGAASFFFLSTLAVVILMIQETKPRSTGFASSLAMGFSWSVGGLFTFLFGYLADAKGLETVLQMIILLPALSSIPAFLVWVRRRNRSSEK